MAVTTLTKPRKLPSESDRQHTIKVNRWLNEHPEVQLRQKWGKARQTLQRIKYHHGACSCRACLRKGKGVQKARAAYEARLWKLWPEHVTSISYKTAYSEEESW